jgi:Ca2+-binding RTX toxin-like protein
MGWYSQGTQVVDFVENLDGTVTFKEAGYFIPGNANEWVSHVFKMERNDNGTFTYYGAAGDFNLGESGRNAIDIYKVTLPAPPKPLGASSGGHCKRALVGSDGAEQLLGGRDDDLIRGRGGKDRIRGRAGSDCLFGGKSSDSVRGDGGRDSIKGNTGRDVLRGGSGRDVIKGGSGGDKLNGGSGNDRINVRGGGHDQVRCGRGQDVVRADKDDELKDCEKVRRGRR